MPRVSGRVGGKSQFAVAERVTEGWLTPTNTEMEYSPADRQYIPCQSVGQMDAIPGMLLLLLTLWTKWTRPLPSAQRAATSRRNGCSLRQARQRHRASQCGTGLYDGKRTSSLWRGQPTGGLLPVFVIASSPVPFASPFAFQTR